VTATNVDGHIATPDVADHAASHTTRLGLDEVFSSVISVIVIIF